MDLKQLEKGKEFAGLVEIKGLRLGQQRWVACKKDRLLLRIGNTNEAWPFLSNETIKRPSWTIPLLLPLAS